MFCVSGSHSSPNRASVAPDAAQIPNTQALGEVIYTQYILPFQGAGIILLVAMIGAIILCHRTRPGVHRQNVAKQVNVKRSDVVEVRSVPTGKGV